MSLKSRKKCFIICLNLITTILICSLAEAEQNFNDLSNDIKPQLETSYFPPSASAQSYSVSSMQLKQQQQQTQDDITGAELASESQSEEKSNEQAENSQPDLAAVPATDQADTYYHYDTRSSSVQKEKTLISNSDKLKPLCPLSPEKFERIRELIEKQADDLFNKSIPEIDFSLGSRVESFDYSGGDNAISPGVSASVSFPLYQPDLDATRAQKQQAYLTQCLTNLNILENNWYAYQTLSKKRDIQKKIIAKEKDIKLLDAYFKNENDMTTLISNINQAIRYLDIMLKIKIESWS